MKNKVIWIDGKTTNTLLGKIWETEPTGAIISVILWEDHSFRFGKYSIERLLHDSQDELLIIEVGNQWIINTKIITKIVPAPRPSWLVDATVPVNPALLEQLCYYEPEYWYYTIGLNLTVMASDFPTNYERYDAFVIHASEDKSLFVRPLVYRLRLMGFKIWFDEFEIKLGDSIRQTIDRGLSISEYGVAVISHMFLKKQWPQYELNGLITREMMGKKTVLPVWYNITFEEVMQYSPPIADKAAVFGTSDNIEDVVDAIANVLRTKR